MDDNDMEYKLDIDNDLSIATKWPKKAKILFGTFLIISILAIIALIILVILYSKHSPDENSKEKENESTNPSIYDFLISKKTNLTYDEDEKIKNSFKSEGENYNENIGNLNNGLDYNKNARNVYNLYIPQTALYRKDKTVGVILWIHGGAWVGGNPENMEPFCLFASNQGYITASMGYTLLIKYFQDFNIYRILDEVTECIKAIKNELIKSGFKEDKLILGIGGYSAGAHLALLYSYLIQNINIIPIKFVINICGPIGLRIKYFYKLKSGMKAFDEAVMKDISAIEKAKEDGTIIPTIPDMQGLLYMNAFYGNKYTDEELNSMLYENGTINYENENYKKMEKFTKNAYVTEIEDKHKLPTLCVYGGIDDIVGVAAFAYLKQKMDKDKRPYDFIYSKTEGHLPIIPTSKEGKEQLIKISQKIIEYFHKYFGY